MTEKELKNKAREIAKAWRTVWPRHEVLAQILDNDAATAAALGALVFARLQNMRGLPPTRSRQIFTDLLATEATRDQIEPVPFRDGPQLRRVQ